MEFLRFGSRIPGSYHGCCAFDIIQNFNHDPDKPASIQLVCGDAGQHLTRYDPSTGVKELFLGKTWKEIFLARLRIGTFSLVDLPSHGFLAILTEDQLKTTIGKKWLALLKENGFEFVRTVHNSVYTSRPHPNYLFALFRNIGRHAIADPFTPPQEWNNLPECTASQQELWDRIGKPRFFTEEELVKDDIPVWLAGKPSQFQQQLKETREYLERLLAEQEKNKAGKVENKDPFKLSTG